MPGICQADPSRLAGHSILRPGMSIGDETGTIGTLGLFVVDVTDTLCLLSAKHVIAPTGHTDSLRPVLHPAEPDQRGATRHVASLWWWERRVDAALARIEHGLVCRNDQMGTGKVIRSFREPVVGDILEKSARTTGTTRARVAAVERPAAELTNAFILERLSGDTEPISCDGDSGAVWYDPETLEGVGLHHGGEPEAGKTVAVSLILIKGSWNIEPWNGEFIGEENSPT